MQQPNAPVECAISASAAPPGARAFPPRPARWNGSPVWFSPGRPVEADYSLWHLTTPKASR